MTIKLQDQEFKKFSQLIFKYAGIHMHEGKKALVEGRLRKRLVALGLKSYSDYYKIVKGDSDPLERQQFIDLLTTNETWFFREEKHFDFVAKQMKETDPQKEVSFWSAACSSGQEPYSISMLMGELRNFQRPWNILATDISTDILRKAKKAIYFKDRVRGLSKQREHHFMLKGVRKQAGYIAVAPEVKKKVEFKAFNLMSSALPSKKFDYIFCRNVLIYFEPEQKLHIINRLSQCLKTDGFLFTGHSESLHGICDTLEVVQPSVYRRKHE